jgi:hypothetical protein
MEELNAITSTPPSYLGRHIAGHDDHRILNSSVRDASEKLMPDEMSIEI